MRSMDGAESSYVVTQNGDTETVRTVIFCVVLGHWVWSLFGLFRVGEIDPISSRRSYRAQNIVLTVLNLIMWSPRVRTRGWRASSVLWIFR
jgi:hypothetical protein